MLPPATDLESPPAALRVLIVDDEPLARDCIRLALRRAPDVAIVAECSDGVAAVDAIRMHAPDIVFLDVQMPGLDGFGVIDRVGSAAMPTVVFVTAFDAHAIRAFEVHALDYVIKPFGDGRLLAALDRARTLLRERQHGELGRRLAEVVREWSLAATGRRAGDQRHSLSAAIDWRASDHHAAGVDELDAGADVTDDDDATTERLEEQAARRAARATYVSRFAVREDGRVRFVTATDVDWIEADGNYVALRVGAARHRLRSSLRHLIEELDPKRFVRIHRSVIVNVERIREVQPWFGGDYIAILHSGAKLKVSRMRASQLLRPMA